MASSKSVSRRSHAKSSTGARSVRGQRSGPHYWSAAVAAHSDALDLEQGVFAMSMLNFYINRAGKGLGEAQLARLQAAKSELRALYGRPLS
jgi:hypothetical protein